MCQYVIIEKSPALKGEILLSGAKNSVLVIMTSTLLASGKSKLYNVPISDDVYQMINLLTSLGAKINLNEQENSVEIDTTNVDKWTVSPENMKKMRASILVMGPLLARFGKADVALPGGCVLGARPIDFHLKGFAKMGVTIEFFEEFIKASAPQKLKAEKIVFEYPSVGATENILMAATLTKGKTTILNAALEPEIFDLISILTKMGAKIKILPPATIEIEGVDQLKSVEHEILSDRLEAGSILLAAAVTGGTVKLPNAPGNFMDLFLDKLSEMGHTISVEKNGAIDFKATKTPKAVSFKTMPYPGFPTDLQAPMLAAQCLASGTSTICETVYESRLIHINELQKMGAQISLNGQTAVVKGVDALYGANVIASDIRASAALVIAGLAAHGQTIMTGVHHLKRGYQNFDQKLASLGAKIKMEDSVS